MQRYTLYLPIRKSRTEDTDSTIFCDTDMLSITSLWKVETEVFMTNICEMQSCYSSSQTLMWDAEEPYFISWQIFVIRFKSHDMYIVLYDKYLWDAGQGRWQISHGRHKSLSPAMAECDNTRLPMAMTPRKCILNKSWKQWLLLFCPFMCQCNASWSYWSIAVSCTRLKGKCPFSQPSATDLHLNASILTTSDQPCAPRTYFLNQIKSGQKKEFIKTSSWHTLRHTAWEF